MYSYMCTCTFCIDPEQDLKLSLSPLESSRSPGESLYLSCSVAEPADFSWTFDDGPLPSNGAVTRTTLVTSVLALKDIMPENAGAYTCRAKNDDRGVMNEDTSYLTITSECVFATYYIKKVCTNLKFPPNYSRNQKFSEIMFILLFRLNGTWWNS